MPRFIASTILLSTLVVVGPFSIAETTQNADQCDRLAAHKTDPTRPPGIPGVNFDDIDPDRAIPACQQALTEQPNIGRFAFELGRAFEKSGRMEDAENLYAKAVLAGHVKAMVNLGTIYRKEKRTSESIGLFRKAADAGFSEGFLELGNSYELGAGVPEDTEEAARLWHKSAELNDPLGMYRLGGAYYQGKGVLKDVAQGYRWVRKAAEAGDLGAMDKLGALLLAGNGVTKDEQEGIRWIRRAAEGGQTDAMINLGYALIKGEGAPKNETEGLQWLRKAADAGDPVGMRNLGVAYATGLGTAKDEGQGLRWLHAASDKGDETAKVFLWRLRPAIPRSLPNTEEFMGIISTCATSNKISLEGDLTGSIRGFYEAARAEGRISLNQSSELLSLFPEGNRSEVYKTYVSCVLTLVSRYQGAISESDVKLIRDTEGNDGEYKIALSTEAASRLASFRFDDLVSKAYYVTFSVSCARQAGQEASRGPFVFKYASDFFSSLYNAAMIPSAYNPSDDVDDSSISEDEKKHRSEIYAKIRDQNIIFSVSLLGDMRAKYKELSDDVDTVFGKGKCSVSDMKTDAFLLVTTTGKDGFDDKHFFKLSGAVSEILDGVPQVKVKLDRSNETEFVHAKDQKVSFEYKRYEVMTSGDAKVLVGLGLIESGMTWEKYNPSFVQPTVVFLRTVKAKRKT